MSKIEGVQNKKIQLISMYSYIKRRHEHKMEKWDERRKGGKTGWKIELLVAERKIHLIHVFDVKMAMRKKTCRLMKEHGIIRLLLRT